VSLNSNSIESILDSQGFFIFTGNGNSMWPLLRERVDTVEVRRCSAAPRRGDVVLFRGEETYTLHRVMAVLPDRIITRGDNCSAGETVPTQNIVGVLTTLWRGERKIVPGSLWWRVYTFLILHCQHALLKVSKRFIAK